MAYKYQCPCCGSVELDVIAKVRAALYQSPVDDDTRVEIEDFDVGWDDTSTMLCAGCDHVGEAHEFDTTQEGYGDDD